MSNDRTYNSTFWTKEEENIFENTLAVYFKDDNLLRKMEEALPWKSRNDIIHHYNILTEDVTAIESGHVPLPNYPDTQSDSNQNSKAGGEWRRGASWTEVEHRSFLEGLEKYGRGDWRSISRNCVITRTPTQVASHAQKYFKRLEDAPKEKRRKSILDITSADAEPAGTSQLVPSTNNESSLPQESTSAEQMIAFAGGESSAHNVAFGNPMNGLYPTVNDEFISGDDLIMEHENANESGLRADAGRSLLPSEQPFTAASSGNYSHSIPRIGSDLEALITEHAVEDNDINSIFDVGKAPTSHPMFFNAAHSGTSNFTATSFGANNAPENNVVAHSGMSSYAAASFGANNAPENNVVAHSRMPSYAAASFGAMNAPQNTVAAHSRMTSFAGTSIVAMNAPQNMMAAPAQLPPFAPSSNFGVGVCPNLNTSVDGEGIFDLHDLFTDRRF